MRRLGSMGDISPAKASHQKKKGFFHKLVRPWKWRKRGKRGGGGEKGTTLVHICIAICSNLCVILNDRLQKECICEVIGRNKRIILITVLLYLVPVA